ncbi:MAG TPA: SCP-2 sterol transfer family protein [Acidimicrobiia bacterium]
MAKFPFLSPEWFTEVRRLHAEHGNVLPPEADVRMNLRVTETPFGDDREFHMAAAAGGADWGEGHLVDADVTLILGYATAKDIFVMGNPQAAIEAFMAGRITISGDITKLMVAQAAQPGPDAIRLALALQEITE